MTTAAPTRLGRVIGGYEQTANSILPDNWKRADAVVYMGTIYIYCYVGPLSEEMAIAI
jgi:hypothetical protein